MRYDVVIVGGGTAGCILANRLSEDPERTVLLLEAGPDFASTAEIPADILSAQYPPMSHDWGYLARSTDESDPIFLPRGKIIGGSSSTNYCFAARTRPADHDAWAALGLDGWGYDDVLPLYRAMESDAAGDERWHGREGLFHVARPAWDAIAPTAQAFGLAAEQLGHPILDDVNAPGAPGFGIVPRNVGPGELRESLAISHLNPVRDRANLTVRGDTLVDRVLFEGTCAVGVLLADGERIDAAEVVVSAGPVNSPALLLRSGVGPADELAKHGIAQVQELPVGRNLMDHPVFWNIYAAKPSDAEVATVFQSALSVKVDPDEPDYDLHLLPSSVLPAADVPPQYVPPTENHPTGFDFVVFVSNMQPRSRGTVTLASTEPAAAPLIDLDFYSAEGDVEIMVEGIRQARRLVQQSPLAELLVEERSPGAELTTDAELTAAVRKGSTHYNHVSGTCRMGVAGDPAAVVDGEGRVHGLDGLRVVDASIMPTIPRVAINPTTVLIAEKISRTF